MQVWPFRAGRGRRVAFELQPSTSTFRLHPSSFVVQPS